MEEVRLTGATVVVHLPAGLVCHGQDHTTDIHTWCLVGWHADGRLLTCRDLRVDEECLTRLDFGDLPQALALLRQALPGAQLRISHRQPEADADPAPFFAVIRSLSRPHPQASRDQPDADFCVLWRVR